jgi:hypothetical protein
MTDSIRKKTEVLYGAKNAVQRGASFMSNVKSKMDICFDSRAPSIVAVIDEYKNGYRDIRRRGGRIRLLTEITNENIIYCKQLIDMVDELRHLDGIKGGLAVSETEFMATTVLQETKPLTQVIYSNMKEVVEQGQYIFDTLWDNNAAIPAKQRIGEIEHGHIREFIDTLRDPYEVQKLARGLVKSAAEEILIIFPTGKALHMQERLGMMKLLLEAAREQHVRIQILIGTDGFVKEEMEKLKRSWSPIDIRPLETNLLQTKLLVIVIDKALSLAIDLKNNSDDGKDEIGLATYSNSESTVLSYVSIFEVLWAKRELLKEKGGTISQA